MKLFKNLGLVFILVLFTQNYSKADLPRYLDFKYILNESDAGKKAQTFLKKSLNDGIKKIQDKEKSIQEDEKRIIKQKKVISADEYKKQVTNLRSKVASLQKERKELLDRIAKQRSKARNELLKNLNPIIKEYMQKNNVRVVLDKKSLLLADENLDITEEIIKILNKKLKSIKLN
tara:strand:- start:500 stop:1024 length:525 start_codon:yes stop_codon:yes gene_type:complete